MILLRTKAHLPCSALHSKNKNLWESLGCIMVNGALREVPQVLMESLGRILNIPLGISLWLHPLEIPLGAFNFLPGDSIEFSRKLPKGLHSPWCTLGFLTDCPSIMSQGNYVQRTVQWRMLYHSCHISRHLHPLSQHPDSCSDPRETNCLCFLYFVLTVQFRAVYWSEMLLNAAQCSAV